MARPLRVLILGDGEFSPHLEAHCRRLLQSLGKDGMRPGDWVEINGVVGEVVAGEEARLRALLSLPRGGSIRTHAAEGGAAIRSFLDPDYKWRRTSHDAI